MKSQKYSDDLQAHVLMGGAPPIAAGVGRYFVALHTEDPSSANEQTTHEIRQLARVPYARSKSTWEKVGNSFVNTQAVSFGQLKVPVSGPVKVWSLGLSESGDGQIIITGKLTSEQALVVGASISFPAGSLVSHEF